MLRRRGTPAGGLALLCLVLAVPAQAAAPAPDPPPEAVAPEAPPVARTTSPAPVRKAPVVVAPVVHRAAPVTRAQPVPKPAATPKPKHSITKVVVVKNPKPVVKKPAVPHDRRPLPLARFVPTVEELNRGLAALAGVGLALVAVGGALVLTAARRELAR